MSASERGTPARPLRAFAEELVRSGVRDVTVSPGSRSTPLALALRAHPALKVWVHLDERAAAFFALGAAKASRRPVAALSTSGTAAVNFAPAVAEARQSRVPLLLLTADRPPELRDREAPQTIDQDHLYGRFAKWFAELPVPEDSDRADAYVRGVVGRAVATALEAPAGPVHLNLPFREPLLPEGSLEPDSTAATPFVDTTIGVRSLRASETEALAARVAAAHRGLIVCGPLDAPAFPGAVTALATATGFPILADVLSNVRNGHHDRSMVVARPDALVRSARFRAAHVPDLVLRFGGTPTSKALVEMLQEHGAPQLVIDDGGWAEPTGLPLTMIHAEPAGLAAALAAAAMQQAPTNDEAWTGSWLAAGQAADDAIRTWQSQLDEPFEGSVPSAMASSLADGAIVFAGNSMPVRDLDGYLEAGDVAVRCLANRGANGIDGLVSTALGVAAVDEGPVVAIVGDVAFIHDLNALLTASRHGISATIVLVNNDGGGIFSFLPQAQADRPELGLPAHYEELFATPHGLDLGPLVTALGGEHRQVTTDALGAAVRAAVDRPGVQVLEVRTDRARNVELHRQATDAATDAIDRLIVAEARS